MGKDKHKSATKGTLTASGTKDGDWYVAQCVEADIANQGETLEAALANLREAIDLHFEPPIATLRSKIQLIEVKVGTA